MGSLNRTAKFTSFYSEEQKLYMYIYYIYDIHDYFLQTVLRLCDLNYTIKMLVTVIYNDISVIFYVDKIHKLHVHVFTDFISFQVTALY